MKRNHLCCCCIHLDSEFIHFCTFHRMFNTLRACSNRCNVVHSYQKIYEIRRMIIFTACQHMYSKMNEITSIRSSGSLIVFSSSTCIPSSFSCQKVRTDEMLPKMSIMLMFIHIGETSDRENQRM